MNKLCLAILPALLLAACTTPPSTPATDSTQPAADARVAKAVVTPLSDLNLVHENIAPVLASAMKNPYQAPPEKTCSSLAEQVRALDAALGPDLDAHVDMHKSLADKGKDALSDAAVGAVERTAEGVVPFRSWIRKLSGAEQRSKDQAAATAAGVVRRAYLKGMGESLNCEAPAAPLPRPAVKDGDDSKDPKI